MSDHTDLPFKAEYAKSSRASCKACKGGITQDSLRLAVMVQVSLQTINRLYFAPQSLFMKQVLAFRNKSESVLQKCSYLFQDS